MECFFRRNQLIVAPSEGNFDFSNKNAVFDYNKTGAVLL